MASTNTESDNKRLVKRLLEGIWLHQNVNVVDEVIAEDIVVTNPSCEVELFGVSQFKKTLRIALKTFSDVEVTIKSLLVEDDEVVARWTVKGAHEEPLMEIEGTNGQVEWANVSIFTCKDGRITNYWAIADVYGFMLQAGLLSESTGE